MIANLLKLFYAAFTLLSCACIYLHLFFYSSVYRVIAGMVLCYIVFLNKTSLNNRTFNKLLLSLVLMIIPFVFYTPFNYQKMHFILVFYLLSSMIQIQLIKSEGTHIFQKKYNKFAYLIVLALLLYLQFLNNLKVADSIFFIYVAFGIVRGIHFWLSINRNARFESYCFGIAATSVLTISELLWSLNGINYEFQIDNILIVFSGIFHFVGDFLLVESTIRNTNGY